MRRTKKILAAILAMIMVLSMSMTVSAATIKINDGDTEGSTYHAYKLLNAEYAASDETLIAYTLNEKYADALRTVTGYTKGSDIVSYIGGLKNEEIRDFADSMYAEIKTLGEDYITDTNEFSNIDQGYYLIVEKKLADEADTYSLVMLDTAGEDAVTVYTKEGVPELVKKVQERNDTDGIVTEWQDGADYDIGDSVPFQLIGTVSSQYDNYATYYYAFHDTLSAGFIFEPDSVVVKVDDEEITEGFEVSEGPDDDCSFEICFEDLKTITAVSKDSKIVVEYTAKLTKEAVIGPEGNPNIAYLEYCNNPYYDGNGSGDGSDGEDTTSVTPKDKVIVFTYELDVNKVDKKGNSLAGAGFTLYKLVKENENAEGEYVAVGEEIVGTEDEPITEFKFVGLDAGQYKLEETTVPEGYNKADDVEFTVIASYATEADNPQFIELTVEVDQDLLDFLGLSEDEEPFSVEEGVISTNVVNLAGYVLPSTGGIGTTIFYIAGVAIMLGAVVLFVKSRRAGEKK